MTVLVVAASAIAVAPASPAAAAPCNYSWSNKSGEAGWIDGDGVNYRGGPYTSCDSFGQFDNYDYVYAHCWRRGTTVGYTDVWWHVRLSGTTRQGWVSEYYTLYLTSNAARAC
ncbi:hypothetical protein ACFP2T_45765 [Plantactinospora solaniradicis]|uniref:SH3 domain-containing protein n=1 Tax=Plantactinospora solaniradicis TaxID=1723736 RepID=A0ABW1KRK4_9ACTN